MKKMTRLLLVLRGMAMGIAEVIPGVSGGTIAFITGIYEELIETIKAFDLRLVHLLRQGKWRSAWQHIHGSFLVFLLTGMAAGMVTGIFGITHLMEVYPNALWAFFFGLILASAFLIGKDVQRWTIWTIMTAVAGILVAYIITILSPVEGSQNLIYVFICGSLAISALILPGISGSFILLLLGMYTVVIPTVRNILLEWAISDILLIAVFAAGCIVGLMTFSRFLSWMFHHYKDLTFALLTGFMIGSLNKIWPWRNPVRWISESGQITETMPPADLIEQYKIVREVNVLPAQYALGDPHVWQVVLLMLLGFLCVMVFLIKGKSERSIQTS